MLIDFSKLDKSSIKKPTYKKKKSAKNVSSAAGEALTSKDVAKSLRLKFIEHKYIISNAFIFQWESDFFSVSESGYVYEVEIKVTRGDFKDDFNKVDKHKLLEAMEGVDNFKRPNKFFYAAPKGLLKTIEIPEYAGFIEITSPDEMPVIVKTAPFLHRENLLEPLRDTLLDKFYNRYYNMLVEADMAPAKNNLRG